MFNRSCYLLIVSIVSSHCRIRSCAVHAFLNHHVWLGFCVRWPAILSVDYRGRFVNQRIRRESPEPKMEHLFEFADNLPHESLNCSHVMFEFSKKDEFELQTLCSHEQSLLVIHLPNNFFRLPTRLLAYRTIEPIKMQFIKSFASFC